nr:hypothetical protein CFP56_73838 [Quercus suber]
MVEAWDAVKKSLEKNAELEGRIIAHGWTNALDKQEVVVDSILRNEEEIPIPNNYLPDVLAVTKGDRGGSVAEEEAPET